MGYQYGIFDEVAPAIEACKAAQKEYVTKYSLEDRDRIIDSMRKAFMDNMDFFTKSEFEEAGYGRIEDKVAKNTGAFTLSPGTECLKTNMYASDKGLTVEYYAPFGIIGAVTPVTNPVATIAGNGIAALASGNGIVFNVHPGAKNTSAAAVKIANEAIVAAGGPDNMLVMVKEPTMATLDDIMFNPAVKLLVGTGGPGMVKTLMGSGKKVVAAGAGNPPSIIDETADIKKAAAGITESSSFDNNLLCIAEKEMFVVDAVYDAFLEEMKAVGNVVISAEDAEKVTKLVVLEAPDGTKYINKKYVGKCANVILEAAGIPCPTDPRLALFEADYDHPLVWIEQMMPIIPVVRCKDFEEAMERAYAAEQDNKHSASIWSKNIDHVTAFGTIINTTIFVQNGGTMAAFGIGGSGTNGPTIATPTGEGVVDGSVFTRRRRFCMADGGNYLL